MYSGKGRIMAGSSRSQTLLNVDMERVTRGIFFNCQAGLCHTQGVKYSRLSRILILALFLEAKVGGRRSFHCVILGRQMRHRFFDFHSAELLSHFRHRGRGRN
jgi:hypothetical protein